MGIQNLKKFLVENCPQAFSVVSLSNMSGLTLALDFLIYAYALKATRDHNIWINDLFVFLNKFVSNNIKLIVVFEGKSPHEKNETKMKRKEQRNKMYNKLAFIKTDLNKYETSNDEPSELLTSIIENNNKHSNELFSDFRKQIGSIPSKQEYIKIIKDYITKSERGLVSITYDEVVLIKKRCLELNIKFEEAIGEAENKCVEMCIRGEVDGVISDDSDVICLGAPLIFTKAGSMESFTQIKFPILLQNMELTHDQFRDFCIMAGTDYNRNIPRIGIAKSFKYIKKYGSIENFICNEPKLDVSNIKDYKNIRRLFTIVVE